MTVHQLLCETNWQLIRGKPFSNVEKKRISELLLAAASGRAGNSQYGEGTKSPDGVRLMYPLFFIPPNNNGKKLITINGVMPKTQILSSNHYELEILRLLAQWCPGNARMQEMLLATKERLAATCFGKFCAAGECFEASIVALRFLSSAFPKEEAWIGRLAEGIQSEIDKKPKGKKRHSGTTFYYWLTLTEMSLPAAMAEIRRYEPVLLRALSRSYSYSNPYDKLYNPIAKYIVRNCLARLPEYRHFRELEGYEGADGRFHVDFHKPMVRTRKDPAGG